MIIAKPIFNSGHNRQAYQYHPGGLKIKMETGPDASWGMKVLDNTLRKQLGGPCKVPWKEGVRSALSIRHPDAVVN